MTIESRNRGRYFKNDRPSACSICDREFSSDRNFDKHRVKVQHSTNQRVCVDPSTVGLVLNTRGIWVADSPQKRPEHWRACE